MEIYDYWKKELTLDKKYKLKGFSRGSLRTGFMLLPTKIFLDCGVPSPVSPNAILITHGHQDHIDALYSNIISDNSNNKITIVGTHNLINNLKDYLSACKSLNCGFKSKFNNWIPLSIITNLKITVSNTLFDIQSYYLDHEVECIAYGLSECRKKLKDEYKEKTQEELIELKKTETIDEEYLYPVLLFCGDMGYISLETLPFEKYPYVIIECTFFDVKHKDEAIEKKHLHIDNLLPYFDKYKETKFILIHFSCRYTKKELKEYFSKYTFDNVIYWL
jgi:ribonuclease BN (tRNA processing enzyme)